MTAYRVECVAGCPEPFAVEQDEPTRCPSCGTRYDGVTVLSSPLPDVEPGAEAERVGVARDDPKPTGGATITIQVDGNASVERG